MVLQKNINHIKKGNVELWFDEKRIRRVAFNCRSWKNRLMKEWTKTIINRKPGEEYLFYFQIIPEEKL